MIGSCIEFTSNGETATLINVEALKKTEAEKEESSDVSAPKKETFTPTPPAVEDIPDFQGFPSDESRPESSPDSQIGVSPEVCKEISAEDSLFNRDWEFLNQMNPEMSVKVDINFERLGGDEKMHIKGICMLKNAKPVITAIEVPISITSNFSGEEFEIETLKASDSDATGECALSIQAGQKIVLKKFQGCISLNSEKEGTVYLKPSKP